MQVKDYPLLKNQMGTGDSCWCVTELRRLEPEPERCL